MPEKRRCGESMGQRGENVKLRPMNKHKGTKKMKYLIE
jgi:hypothetical protein